MLGDGWLFSFAPRSFATPQRISSSLLLLHDSETLKNIKRQLNKIFGRKNRQPNKDLLSSRFFKSKTSFFILRVYVARRKPINVERDIPSS